MQKAEDRKLKQEQIRNDETTKNLTEIHNLLNGKLLTETPDALNIQGGHQIRSDLFKGFTIEQNRDILMMNEFQRREAAERRRKEVENENHWDQQMAATNQAMIV